MKIELVVAVALAACDAAPDASADTAGEVVGPFTGPVHRYAIRRITVPRSSISALSDGDSYFADAGIANAFGLATAWLVVDLANERASEAMWATGVLASSVEIQADDLADDPTVAVSYLGRQGAVAVPAAGRFVHGVFASNRVRATSHPAGATLVLPIFGDADPTEIVLDAGEIDLEPKGDGYHAVMRGKVDADAAENALAASVVQMVRANPHAHGEFARRIDRDRDADITLAEASAFFHLLLGADLGNGELSLGFEADLVPCDAGACSEDATPNTCLDRTQDGAETDIDCGGTCRPCAAGATCTVPADCDSGACTAGVCAPGTCGDHRQDDLELDVDCGAPYCLGCFEQPCETGADCASGTCNGGGVCT